MIFMANKGSSGHIKRLNAPKYFFIRRKGNKYIIKQNPGRHTLERSVALSLIVRKLDIAPTRFESDRVIKDGLVSVNGKKIKEPKFPVGLNDAISIGSDNYIIGIDSKGHISISASGNAQIFKVVGKYKNKGNSIMLRLHDGRVVAGNLEIKVDDSVSLSERKIGKAIKLESGSKCRVIDGVHVGIEGRIKEINAGSMYRQKSVVVEQQNGRAFETLVKNIIVVE